MKKTFIAALFLIFTATSFAQDINTDIGVENLVGVRGPGGFADQFSEIMPEKSKVGSCNVLESNYKFVGGMEEYVSSYEIYLSNGNKKFGILLSYESRVDVYRINDINGVTDIYDANTEKIKSGRKITQRLRIINSPSSVDIMVETKKENKSGIMEIVKNKTFRCISQH